LKRLRIKILKTENTENGSLYETLFEKIKGLKGIKGKVMLRKGLALMMILAVIVTAYWQNTPYASAATEA
jgi:hypothetical protein